MKTSKTLKMTSLAGALLAAVCSTQVYAEKPGYTEDREGVIVRNNFGECWRTGSFDKAAHGLVECGDAEAKKVVAAPTQRLVKERISFSAEVLFDFDKSTIRAEGRSALDPVVEKLRNDATNLQAVEVRGHTDALGSVAYNQRLSERRAAAVKDYLVQSGVPAERVTAVGLGKAEAKMTAECRARFKKRADLIACLGPDRRVDVDISAMREETITIPAK